MSVRRPPNAVQRHPNAEVSYWDSVGVDGKGQRRRYEVDGEKAVSVTTLLGAIVPKHLTRWAQVEALKGLCRIHAEDLNSNVVELPKREDEDGDQAA